jgi:hypothetical protein
MDSTREIRYQSRQGDRVAARLAAQLDEIEANPGRRGNPARRAAICAIARVHEQHMRNLHAQDRAAPRAAWHAKHVRESIRAAQWQRGAYGELLLPWIVSETHPALAEFVEARTILHKATDRGLLPRSYQDWDSKGRGSGVSVDLYGYTSGLVLVQVREVSRRCKGYYLSVRKTYYITDGETRIEAPKFTTRKAATADQSADATLRAARPYLAQEWQDRISDVPVKWQGKHAPELTTVFKALDRWADGSLHSIWDNSWTYTIGAWSVQKAQPHHGGGLYAYRTREDAQAWLDGQTVTGTGVLCSCTGKGVPLSYGSKLAFSALRVDAIL